MAKRKQVEPAGSDRIPLINWIIRKATARNGTVCVHDGTLFVSVPTAKPGGYGEEGLFIPLTPSELEVFGNIEAIGK